MMTGRSASTSHAIASSIRRDSGGRRSTRQTRFVEEPGRIIVRVGLDVLRQGDGDCAGLGRVGQDAHCLGQRRQQLLGPGDAVEETADGAETVVDADIGGNRVFELLEDRPLAARGVVSDGSSRTGSRLMVAVAAPVIMLVEPGPMDAVQASVASRRLALA